MDTQVDDIQNNEEETLHFESEEESLHQGKSLNHRLSGRSQQKCSTCFNLSKKTKKKTKNALDSIAIRAQIQAFGEKIKMILQKE